MLLSWARHGQNVANLTETFSHRVFDGDLTELGREQAHALGRRLAAGDQRFGLLATSPLRRATQTAEIVSAYLELPVSLALDEFREVNVGELDGRNDEAAWQIYTAVLQAWRDGDLAARFPGGEDAHELVGRIRSGIAEVITSCGSDAALVVAHGANIRAALPTLAGVADPGGDLHTGDLAQLEVTPAADRDTAVALIAWGAAAA